MTTASSRRALEALVQTGAAECRYLRMGAGTRVLFLLPARREAWIDAGLVQRLAHCCCAIVPELPAGDATFGDWLAGFLDGTGLSPCTVVAEAGLAPVLEPFARLDDRIVRLLFIADRTADAQAADVLVRMLVD